MAGTGGRGTSPSEFIAVGRVLSPWGNQGEIRVEVLTDFPERLAAGGRVFIRGEGFSIRRSRWHKGHLLVELDRLHSQGEAAALRGQHLEIPLEAVSPLPPDSYYHFEIIGLKVWTTSGELLGEIQSVLSTGSNDIYVVKGSRGEVLIPAIEDVVKAVELEKGRMVIEPIAGLLK